MTDKTIIKNAHCKFFEGQTGLCKAKEFTKCNPVNCKLYTIDELSTILELQDKLKRKEQECEELNEVTIHQRKENTKLTIKLGEMINRGGELYGELQKYKQAIDEIGKLIPKFDSSLGCDYGDFDCENCSDLDEDTVCTYKLKKIIKDIINKAKESK